LCVCVCVRACSVKRVFFRTSNPVMDPKYSYI
jgi:hypothetical protein